MYPTNWWVGMKWNKVQLMVRGDKIATSVPMLKIGSEGMELAPGISLKKIERVANPNYIFLNVEIKRKD